MMEGLCQPSRGDVCLLFSPSQPNIHLILPYPSYSPPPPKIKSKTTQKTKIRLEFEKKKKLNTGMHAQICSWGQPYSQMNSNGEPPQL